MLLCGVYAWNNETEQGDIMGNAFALCNSIEEIQNHWEILTSPENLACDGELTIAQQKVKLARFRKDVTERVKQIAQ